MSPPTCSSGCGAGHLTSRCRYPAIVRSAAGCGSGSLWRLSRPSRRCSRQTTAWANSLLSRAPPNPAPLRRSRESRGPSRRGRTKITGYLWDTNAGIAPHNDRRRPSARSSISAGHRGSRQITTIIGPHRGSRVGASRKMDRLRNVGIFATAAAECEFVRKTMKVQAGPAAWARHGTHRRQERSHTS